MLAHPTAHALLRRLHSPRRLGMTPTFFDDQPHGLQAPLLQSIKIPSYASKGLPYIMRNSISLIEGDITKIPADAIVNAANAALAGGGGVDGAIHHVGGPSIMHELDEIRARTGGCPTGEAVITGAGDLPARWVIHTSVPSTGLAVMASQSFSTRAIATLFNWREAKMPARSRSPQSAPGSTDIQWPRRPKSQSEPLPRCSRSLLASSTRLPLFCSTRRPMKLT